MKKPVILIIENSIHVTGALKSITRTAFDLKQYFDFHFILPKNSRGRTWIENKGFHSVHELPLMEINRRLTSLVFYLPMLMMNTYRLRQILKRLPVNLIHNNDLYNLIPVMLSILGPKIPYVCHIRFLPDRFPKLLLNAWLCMHFFYSKKIVAVSQSVVKQLPVNPLVALIHNELPVEERYSDFIMPDQSIRFFLYLSNFIQGKGQEHALEAFALIQTELPDWKLRFVGGDMGLKKNMEYRERLLKLAKKLGILEKTEWKGFTDNVELEYKSADIVLNFSESESFSITCVEANFFGSPVIATDCGGPSEIIVHGKTGLLVPNRSIIDMAQAMNKLAKNDELRKKMAFQAREEVRKKFSTEKTSLKMKQVYDEIIRG